MSFFNSLLKDKNLSKHDGRSFWRYMLNEDEYDKLIDEFRFSKSDLIDPRDASLYFAEWWKRNYNGGSPSKEEIFESLTGNIKFHLNSDQFYKKAKQGAQMLGLKWISKQNTLYFRTLLLQGGLPLKHISENQGKYQAFLIAVLEEQPETIEDFAFKSHIINLLPLSSQNDIIYENCFEIVKSILNKENNYDDLFKSNEVLKNISNTLKIREKTLERKQRHSKPKNYWILNFKGGRTRISLTIGLAEQYNVESLSNILGFNAKGNTYQFYLDSELICVFRKMINGNFKTDWYQQQNREWNGDLNLPEAYVIENNIKISVSDFIQTIPNLNEPSLWSKYSDDEWRLVKGNGTSNKEAAILYPPEWYSDLMPDEISISDKNLLWLRFEGETEITNGDQQRKYFSEVNSFEWTIISQKPSWMNKSNMAVVKSKPTILVYDENNEKVPENRFTIWIKRHNSIETWQELSRLNHLPLGCIDLKIEKDGFVTYDMFFNIGNLQVQYIEQSVDQSIIEIKNYDSLEFKIDSSNIFEVYNQDNRFNLKLDTKFSKIPLGIKGSFGLPKIKKLYFELLSPFQGMAITDKDGNIVNENEPLSLANLYGLRILSTPNNGSVLSIKNRKKPDVRIIKEITESSYPVISFKEEIVRLYYLADAMDHNNQVCLELIEGRNTKTYYVSGFSYLLNVEDQFDRKVDVIDLIDDIDLYAIPLNCKSENFDLIPLIKDNSSFTIPLTELSSQFIIISSKIQGQQLMPRFINTDDSYIGIEKNERIENYHSQLCEAGFEDEIWKVLLSYFNICIKKEFDIPFSTFDQFRAISRSSKLAARAFFFLGFNHFDSNEFIKKDIPEIEKDLGFCFHWIKKQDWLDALDEINRPHDYRFHGKIAELISLYMQENGLQDILKFINDNSIVIDNLLNSDITDLRASLGHRVLKELPNNSPKITKEYNIPISQHMPVRLLLQSPIAVAESIKSTKTEYPIWAGDDFRDSIRRNIQYSQYLNQAFYNRVLIQALNNN